jgi:cytidine deaminase
MGAIRGVAFLDVSGHDPGERAHQVARLAAHLKLPADVVDFGGPLRDLAEMGGRGPISRALGRTVVEQATGTQQGQQALQAILVDEFRWRAWVAHAMGAAFVICPDAPPGCSGALAAMGLRILGPADEAPDLAGLADLADLADDPRQPQGWAGRPARAAAAALPDGGPPELGGDRGQPGGLDDQVRLRALRARAGQVIVGGFQAGAHEVGAVVADRTGAMWYGLDVTSDDGAGSLCAEAVAVGNAIMGGAGELAYVAAVRHSRVGPRRAGYCLVPPCPSCRALLLQAGRLVQVVLEGATGLAAMTLSPAH